MAISPQIPRSGPAPFRALQGVGDLERIVGNVVSGNFASFIPPGGVSGGVGGQIEASSITTSEIAAGTITATNIAASTITGSLIAARTITAGNIVSSTITSNEIAANTITAGDLSATAIDGMVITGSTFRTSSTANTTGAGVVIDVLGVRGYDSSHVQKFNLDATTGLINAQGVILAQTGSTLPVNTLVGLLPGSANRYSNSAFQNGASTFDTTGWTFTNLSPTNGGTTVPVVYGALTMQVQATATTDVGIYPDLPGNSSPYRRVVPGLNYTMSHYVYPKTTARQSQVTIYFYDSTGAQITFVNGPLINTVLNAWTRVSATVAAPANAAYALGLHYMARTTAVGELFNVTCFQMEEGDRASAWAPRPDEILVDQINANNINVANLAAINANLGTITAGSLTAVSVNSSTITGGTITGVTITGTSTITGAVVQTGTTNPKVAMDSTGLWVTNSGGTKLVNIDSTNGITLTQGTGTPNQIVWRLTSGVAGANVAQILSQNIGTNTSRIYVGAMNQSTGYQTYIDMYQDPAASANSYVAATALDTSGVAHGLTIVDATGASNLVQSAQGKVKHFTNGTVNTGTFTGGTNTNAISVGGTAQAYTTSSGMVVSISSQSFLGNCTATVAWNSGTNPATFTITAIDWSGTPAAGATITYYCWSWSY